MKNLYAVSSVPRRPARVRYFSAVLLFEEGKRRPFHGTGSPTPVSVPEYERGVGKPGNGPVVGLSGNGGDVLVHMAVDL